MFVIPHEAAWVTDMNAIRLDVSDYYGASADHSPVPDSDPWKYDSTPAYERKSAHRNLTHDVHGRAQRGKIAKHSIVPQ